MTLIKSISGIRGTVGGKPKENLTPLDIVACTAAFAELIKKEGSPGRKKIVVGRDGRISGPVIHQLVNSTLISMGVDVIDIGLSTTPTVAVTIRSESAEGGIMITASHNPREWNALKFFNFSGEIINAKDADYVLAKEASSDLIFEKVNNLGRVTICENAMAKHVDSVLKYELVNIEAIRRRRLRVVVDTINSTGALCIPLLLGELGVVEVTLLNAEVHGDFGHNPEPLPNHLVELSREVIRQKADIGIAVDPDVDRLCFVCEDGSMFGEEYTLVAVADHVLRHSKGSAVSNLSSSKALKDVAAAYGCSYFASAVGEVNVVEKMKDVAAVIGGEGNGGIIVPDFHYGRDALIGIALFLSGYSEYGGPLSAYKRKFPQYAICKEKLNLTAGREVEPVFRYLRNKYASRSIDNTDGLKISFEDSWIHLRTSNTEAIMRIYSEAKNEKMAKSLALQFISEINSVFTAN